MNCICGSKMDKTMNNGGGLTRIKMKCTRCGRTDVAYSKLFGLASG